MPPRKQAGGPQTPGKVPLAYQPTVTDPRHVPQPAVQRRGRAAVPAPSDDLILMVLDIREEGHAGQYSVWGTTAQGASVLLRPTDFRPYLYIAAPLPQPPDAGGEGRKGTVKVEWNEHELQRLKGLLNQQLPSQARLDQIEAVHRRPLLFYRPGQPEGGTYLKLSLSAGGSVKQAARALPGAMLSNETKMQGLLWRDTSLYEAEVAPLQRFLVDVPVSGGAWLLVPGGRWDAVADGADRVSSCDVEARAPWQAVCCLTPDATQLADPQWTPFGGGGDGQQAGSGGDGQQAGTAGGSSPARQAGEQQQGGLSAAVLRAAEAATRGDIAALRTMVIDVVMATADGSDRTAVAAPGAGRGEGDPIAAICCHLFTTASSGAEGGSSQDAAGASQLPPAAAAAAASEDEGNEEEEEEEEGGEVRLGPLAAPRPARSAGAPVHPGGETLVFLLAPAAAGGRCRELVERSAAQGRSRVLLFDAEEQMLMCWAQTVRAADPDVLAVFQVNDTLAALQQRFEALRLEPGGLKLSRLLPHRATALSIKPVVQYSPQWVKSQARMQSTSNQQTFKVQHMEGRLVVDVLRHLITAHNLNTFSMTDAVGTLLGQTLEVLRPAQVAALAGLAAHAQQRVHTLGAPAAAAAAEAEAMRLARYALRRCDAVYCLLHRLATIPEMIESARATGLTMVQCMYQAQVVRVNSLLLRAAHRQGFLVPGKREEMPLQQSTFILHPVETGTVGLHRQPVAVLDFASLYPSIYRAYNMCYSTLIHKEDQAALPPEQLTVTPTGEAFVKAEVRQGVLPRILSALVAARSMAREQLKAATDPASRAVLDSRQKALKLTSNAVYGFTATSISPLQSWEAADSCLAIGAQSCRWAKELIEEAAAAGKLGPWGFGARCIYAQTDSVFIHLPKAATIKQAFEAGRLAAQVASAHFPDPMRLAFERIMQPFLLLHVNKYAGAAFEREEDVERGGQLVVKGIRSMWRQTAPVVQGTLRGVLERIILQRDIQAAAEFAKGEIRRMLSGQVDMHELTMNGGLWRVTGEQVERLAAGVPNPSDEEIRGPHNALAVRLTQRDPCRSFVLGERVPYVLLAGHKKQDDAAEDPLAAAQAGLGPDFSLYWQKKLLNPLQEIFKAALPPSQEHLLKELTGGEHTRVKVDALSPAAAEGAPAAALPGPASPPPAALGGRGRGGRGGRGPRGSPGGRAGPASAGGAASPAAGQAPQRQMHQFFRQLPKCLSCRSAMPRFTLSNAPALCDSCASSEGKWEETYMEALQEQAAEEARRSAAFAACTACHSGGMAGAVVCQNGECPVTYIRLGTATGLQRLEEQLRRLDIF